MLAAAVQPNETPAVKAMDLPGPCLPADEGADELESKLVVVRAGLANMRHAASEVSLAADDQEANADKVSATELKVDKLLLRMLDGAIKQERLDRALQLISRCAACLTVAARPKVRTCDCSISSDVIVQTCRVQRCMPLCKWPSCLRCGPTSADSCAACSCELERTLAMAVKLANHKRRSMLAERIQAVMEWRFPAEAVDEDDADDPPSQHRPVRPPSSRILSYAASQHRKHIRARCTPAVPCGVLYVPTFACLRNHAAFSKPWAGIRTWS